MNDEKNNLQSDFVNLTEFPSESHETERPFEPPVILNTPPTIETLKKRSRKPFIILLLALILVGVLGAGGVYAYKTFFLTPEIVLAKMYENMVKVKTYAFDGDLDFNFRSDDDTISSIFFPTSAGASFKGAVVLNDSTKPKSELNVDLSTNQSSLANVDITGLGDISYVRLNSVIDLGVETLDSIIGVWIKVDPKELPQEFGIPEQSLDSSLNLKAYTDMKKMIMEKNLFVITETLESENIDGLKMYHYKYEIDEVKLLEFFKELESGYGEISQLPSDFNYDDVLNETFESISFGGELWVGKNDFILHKLTLNISVGNKDMLNGTLNVNMNINLNKFNESITITEPTVYKNFSDVIKELMGNQMETARDTQRRSDLLMITNAIYQYAAEHNGNLPGGSSFPKEETCIGKLTNCFNLAAAGSAETVVPLYISDIPVDPLIGTSDDTGYSIYVDDNGRIVAKAKGELSPEITVTR